jgi:UDP-N-acetylglucosamine 4,6-dehydratase
MLDGKVVLITGGTGSFGQEFTRKALNCFDVKKLIIFSRDELKQFEMKQSFSESDYPQIRYFIGDVRDRERLYRAFDGVDVVVHAAALKQVPSCEYNPIEAIKTNVMGAANVVDAAIDKRVEKVIALSTDKAANPVNLYGATKLCSDKLFVSAESYAGASRTRFSVVRYGNVLGSRGSVIPFFMKMRERGVLPITDPRMTRFWISLEQAVDFVLHSLQRMQGSEIFVPKIPSMLITDLAKAIAPECKHETTGIRPGEKLHEVMVPEDDARHSLENDTHFTVLPTYYGDRVREYSHKHGGTPCPEHFRYSSETNPDFLTVDDLCRIVVNEGYAVAN